jgi:hypothetical protein
MDKGRSELKQFFPQNAIHRIMKKKHEFSRAYEKPTPGIHRYGTTL